MSFVYPRTISISRPTQPNGVGAVGYGAELPATETPVASNVPASIQQKKEGRMPGAGLPGDARATIWRIFFNSLQNGTVADRDIITDDLGIRYQVQAAYWNSLGYNCLCERLEN
jgi:hypothetical protein